MTCESGRIKEVHASQFMGMVNELMGNLVKWNKHVVMSLEMNGSRNN